MKNLIDKVRLQMWLWFDVPEAYVWKVENMLLSIGLSPKGSILAAELLERPAVTPLMVQYALREGSLKADTHDPLTNPDARLIAAGNYSPEALLEGRAKALVRWIGFNTGNMMAWNRDLYSQGFGCDEAAAAERKGWVSITHQKYSNDYRVRLTTEGYNLLPSIGGK